MPIKHENRARYPANWRKIRYAILERAENHCEFCGIPNEVFANRTTGDWTYEEDLAEAWVLDKNKVARIVLTIAHLDHVPENNDGMDTGGPVLPVERSNLRALCQRCHLAHDATHHQQTAYRTRRAGKALGDLFDAA